MRASTSNVLTMQRPTSGSLPKTGAVAVLALQGWAADRYTDRAMIGAGLFAREVARRFGVGEVRLGQPGLPRDIGWRESIERSKEYLTSVAIRLGQTFQRSEFPLIVANRCAATIATIPVAASAHPDACLVWIDAHGDYNTPEITQTGYLGGMVISALCGEWESGFGAGLSPDRVVMVGMRDLDPAEEALLVSRGITLFKPSTDATGATTIDFDAVTEAVDGRKVWLHVDCDVMEPTQFPAEYVVPNGMAPATLRALLRRIVSHAELVGFELTEFEAPLDEDHCAVAMATLMSVIEPVLQTIEARA